MKTLLAAFLLFVAASGEGNDSPSFVKNDTQCLSLSKPEINYSREAIVAAQYRWLAASYPDYKFREHATPKPDYLKKLGCDTKRGSVLSIETAAGEPRTVCFCLPVR